MGMQLLVMDNGSDEKENIDANVPWQVHPLPWQSGMTYGDLFDELVNQETNPVMLLGLFRQFIDSTTSSEGFVWTNPDRSTIIMDTDLLYVLGDRHYGKWAYDSGLIPDSGKSYFS